MHSALLVAKREYLERVKSRAFRVSTLIVPLAFGLIFGIGYLSARLGGGLKHLVVLSNDSVLAESVAAELKTAAAGSDANEKSETNIEVAKVASADDLPAFNRRVDSKEIDGYLFLNRKEGETRPEVTYASRSLPSLGGSERMQGLIGHALVRDQLRKRGMPESSIESLLKKVDVKTQQIKDGKVAPSDAGKSFWGAYVMAFLLYFTVMFYGVNVAQSVAAEKTSRVFEVLLASTTPGSLMAGKLIGVGAAGLTQLMIWMGCLLLFSASSLAAQFAAQGGLSAYGITAIQLIFFPIYFLLGFFLYSSLSAGLGATVGQESEVQQFNMLIMIPQVIAIVLIVYILGNPAAWPVVVLSLVPPFTPIVMCLRMSAMAVPAWQLALSVVLMAGSIWLTVGITSRIYRVGILMYGKRPNLPEMVRWLRYT